MFNHVIVHQTLLVYEQSLPVFIRYKYVKHVGLIGKPIFDNELECLSRFMFNLEIQEHVLAISLIFR